VACIHPAQRASETVFYRWTRVEYTRHRPDTAPRQLHSPHANQSFVLSDRLLVMQHSVTNIPLDSNIPNEQALIILGLSGTPGTDQPMWPIAVDRVLDDGAATYVQWHTSDLSVLRNPLKPQLYDDHGTLVDGGGLAAWGSSRNVSTAWPIQVPSWLPWHPPVIVYGVDRLAPLASATRAAVLTWAGETVHVHLNSRALASLRTSHPGTHTAAAGLTLTLTALTFTHLTYTYAPSPNGLTFAPRAWLVDGSGHQLPATSLGGGCWGSTTVENCTAQWSFPPQRVGARLTLVIPAFLGHGNSRAGRLVHGPWRLPLVVP